MDFCRKHRKKLIILILAGFIFTLFAPTVFAQDERHPLRDRMWGEGFDGTCREGTTFWTRTIAGTLTSIVDFVWHHLGIKDPLMLIFQRYTRPEVIDQPPERCPVTGMEIPRDERVLIGACADRFWVDPADLIAYTFTPEEFALIDLFFTALRSIFPYFLIAGILYAGIVALTAKSTEDVLGQKSVTIGLLFAPALLYLGPYLLEPLFWLNKVIIEVVASALGPIVYQPWLSIFFIPGNINLGSSIIALLAMIAALLLNFQYTVRKIMIAILILMLPIIAITTISPKTRSTFGVWFSELNANIFLQASHAIIYGIFAAFLFIAPGTADDPTTTLPPMFVGIAMLLSLNGMAQLVRMLFGLPSVGRGMGGAAGAALGLGSMLAMGRIIQGACGGRKDRRSAKEKIDDAKEVSPDEGVASGDGSVDSGVPSGPPDSGGPSGPPDTRSTQTPFKTVKIGTANAFRATAEYAKKHNVAGRAATGAAIATGVFVGGSLLGATGGAAGLGIGAAIGAKAGRSGVDKASAAGRRVKEYLQNDSEQEKTEDSPPLFGINESPFSDINEPFPSEKEIPQEEKDLRKTEEEKEIERQRNAEDEEYARRDKEARDEHYRRRRDEEVGSNAEEEMALRSEKEQLARETYETNEKKRREEARARETERRINAYKAKTEAESDKIFKDDDEK